MVRGEVGGGLRAAWACATAASCCWAAAAAAELRSMSFFISDWTRTRCSSFDLSLNSCRISCCVMGLVSPNLQVRLYNFIDVLMFFLEFFDFL